MEMIVYLLAGLISGGALGYFILKLSLQKKFVSKAALDDAEKTILLLRIDNATRLSKEEVAAKYVLKELHENINGNLTTVNKNLEKEKL